MAKKAKKPNGKRPVYKYQPPQSETVEEGQYVGDNVIPIKQKKGRIRSFSDSTPTTLQKENEMDIEGQFKNESSDEKDHPLDDTVEEMVSENSPAASIKSPPQKMSFFWKMTFGVIAAATTVAVVAAVARKKPTAVGETAEGAMSAIGEITGSAFRATTAKPTLFKSNIG